MFSRRQLRTRAMQALYAYHQSEVRDLTRVEKELFAGIEKIYQLYLYLLLFITEFPRFEANHFPKIKDGLAKNKLLDLLSASPEFNEVLKKHKVSCQNDQEMVSKVYYHFRKKDEYIDYRTIPAPSLEEDTAFITWLTTELMQGYEVFEHYLEEKSIYWVEEKPFIYSMVKKTLRSLASDEKNFLIHPWRDEKEDKEFVSRLLHQSILHNDELGTLISARIQNWEPDRIAMIDMLLMKMALGEILYFPEIPVKVSMNEYIDISKEYSTPQSRLFINGVLDKTVAELKTSGKINKTGRGLME